MLARDEVTTLGVDDSDGFEIALRERRTADRRIHELIVNGHFAMDSHDSSSEVALADMVPAGAEQVLIGGLGLGFTAERVLQQHSNSHVAVVELSSALIRWAHEGLTPTLGFVANSQRSTLRHGDIIDVLHHQPSGQLWDAILLDVDNGPDFLIHDSNAAVYGGDAQGAAHRSLRPGGVLAVWSEGASKELHRAMHLLDGSAEIIPASVRRGERICDYVIHCVRRPSRQV